MDASRTLRSGRLALDGQLKLEKLKPGPGMSADQVAAHQRRRLHRAVAELTGGEVFGGLTVRALAGQAGVSSRSFYRHFDNVETCIASAHDEMAEVAIDSSASAQKQVSPGESAVGAAIRNTMETFAADPKGANLVLIEIYGGGAKARKSIAKALTSLEGSFASAFAPTSSSLPVPRHLIAGITAGVLHVARKTALADRCGDLPALSDQVAEWALLLPNPVLLSLQEEALHAADAPGRVEADSLLADQRGARAHSEDDDRRRLLRAAVRLGAAKGFGGLTAGAIRADAGVSRRRFYAVFSDAHRCFLEAIGMAATTAVSRAHESALGDDKLGRTAGLIRALATQAAGDPGLARLILLEIYALGRSGLVQRVAFVDCAAGTVHATAPADKKPPVFVVEASIAAAWRIAECEVAAGRARALPSIAPLLSYVVLAPLAGAEAAAEAGRWKAEIRS